MNPQILLNVLRKNISLVLMLIAIACPVLAVGEVMRDTDWFLLMPVALVAVLSGWWAGRSRLNGRQAAGWLAALGLPGILIYVLHLIVPIWNVLTSAYSTIYQVIRWVVNRSLIDVMPFVAAWNDLAGRVVVSLSRLGEWLFLLVRGIPVVDATAASLAFCLLFWMVGTWAGWQFRQKRLVLLALLPAGIVLTIALEYTREETNLAVLYLILLLALTGLTHYKGAVIDWVKRGVDYSDSIALDSVMFATPVIVVLVGFAMLTPSLSWEDLMDRLREPTRTKNGQGTGSTVRDSQSNVANRGAYRSGGLPRMLLIDTPPELLQTVVMTITTDEDVPSDRYYWRTRTYDYYTGTGWASRRAYENSIEAGTVLIEPDSTYKVLYQTIELAEEQNDDVYWTGVLAQADTDLTIAWRIPPPSNADLVNYGDVLGALTTASVYTVETYIPQISEAQLQAAGRNYPPEIAERYLVLPDKIPGRVLLLAEEITGAERTPYDQAVAIETYLRTIPYSLEVPSPPQGRDVVDYFLFTLQKGYCDYYATSMVVMARATGLPARVVVGYSNGNYNPSTKQYVIRQRHAHTWVEIYFPEIGWVEFEPTSNQSVPSQQNRDSEPQPDIEESQINPGTPWLKVQWLDFISTLGGQFFILFVGLVVMFIGWQLGSGVTLQMLPSHVAIHRIYMRIEKISLYLLSDLPPGHTPLDIQTALSNKLETSKINGVLGFIFGDVSQEIARLTNLHMNQVFSQHPPSHSQVRHGIRIWIWLRWKLWLARILRV